MANYIEVTTTDSIIKIKFNLLSQAAKSYDATFNRKNIVYVTHEYGYDFLSVYMESAGEWQVRHDDTMLMDGVLPIETINGVQPTDLEHLKTLLDTIF